MTKVTAANRPTTRSEPERLQRYLARAGVASRRAAERLITEGRVRVNGAVETELGAKVTSGVDIVDVDGSRVVRREGAHAYYALNKPAGYLTTLEDPQGRPTIVDLMPKEAPRLFAVGRLDADTTGLLILTDDGDLAYRLMHPSFHVPKTYHATVAKLPSEAVLDGLRSGVQLDDGMTSPADAAVISGVAADCVVALTIREGRKRQVRRMFAMLGHPVLALSRVSFGPVELGRLAPGATRLLTIGEVQALRRAAGLPEEE
jgi:pseudouridine synthase